MQSPFPMIPPDLLAKLAQGAFRPPQAMGMQAPNMPQTPGFNMGDGLAGLGMGLAAFRPTGGLNPNGMPEDQNLGTAVAGINALKPDANGVWQQPPMPTDIGSGQGGSFGSWLRGLF